MITSSIFPIVYLSHTYFTQQQQSSQELSNEPKEETIASNITQQGSIRHLNNSHYI